MTSSPQILSRGWPLRLWAGPGPTVAFHTDWLEVRSGGHSTRVEFGWIGHIEIRRRREVRFACCIPGEPPARVAVVVGRLHAEDWFDLLLQARESAEQGEVGLPPFSIVHGDRWTHSRTFVYEELFPWQDMTDRVYVASPIAGSQRVVQTARNAFELGSTESGEVGLDLAATPGAFAIRVVAGRVLTRSGMVLATFERFEFAGSPAHRVNRGFRLRLHTGEEWVYHRLQRRLLGRTNGVLEVAGDGVAVRLDAEIPEVEALMLVSTACFIEQNAGPEELLVGEDAVESRSIEESRPWGFVRMFGPLLVSMAVFGAYSLVTGVPFAKLLVIACGGILATLVCFEALRRCRILRLRPGCGRFWWALHLSGATWRLCTGIVHSPPISYLDLGHLERRGRRTILSRSSGHFGRPVHRVGLFLSVEADAELHRLARLAVRISQIPARRTPPATRSDSPELGQAPSAEAENTGRNHRNPVTSIPGAMALQLEGSIRDSLLGLGAPGHVYSTRERGVLGYSRSWSWLELLPGQQEISSFEFVDSPSPPLTQGSIRAGWREYRVDRVRGGALALWVIDRLGTDQLLRVQAEQVIWHTGMVLGEFFTSDGGGVRFVSGTGEEWTLDPVTCSVRRDGIAVGVIKRDQHRAILELEVSAPEILGVVLLAIAQSSNR